jgi:hypothetical protein
MSRNKLSRKETGIVEHVLRSGLWIALLTGQAVTGYFLVCLRDASLLEDGRVSEGVGDARCVGHKEAGP